MRIDHVEFASPDLEATQEFFAKVFGWSFTDYGPDYRDIKDAGLGGGIERGPLVPPLVILKAEDLDQARQEVVAAGGRLSRDIFAFPGGRRFEFLEPGGTLMAVWSSD
jgi:predicted enzyme related to lactoylglutathione lyase